MAATLTMTTMNPMAALRPLVEIARRRREGALRELARRGIPPAVATRYGVGEGVRPGYVPGRLFRAARAVGLVWSRARWRWDGGVVYADPPDCPRFLAVRRRDGHAAWGRRDRPLGLWRLAPTHRLAAVVEGWVDMLALAAWLEAEGLSHVLPLALGGKPTPPQEEALARLGLPLVLIPDGDEAGAEWGRRLAERLGAVLFPAPQGLDPDEALLGRSPDPWRAETLRARAREREAWQAALRAMLS